MKHFIRYSLAPLAILPLLGLSVTARAAGPTPTTTNSTTVNITATVVDNTCEVDAANPWTLDNIKVSDIMNDTARAVKPVTIVLKNCGTGVSGIDVSTDDAAVDGQGLIANQAKSTDRSSASNVKAEILAGDNATSAGAVLTPTTPIKFKEKDGSPLKFNVKLLPAGGAKPTAGNFMANVALKLAYE
ncbi:MULTISPECIES: fimbrial protein [Pantoea]|jgi:type 1 fimbria pilin|uniref:fimbrial protein n=1 Tax=Pantoea TaxID=53335 RepID=UPI000D71A59C|nr:MULTISPECIES: fimbrial protein [Pantoea]MDC7872114.1 hypothetical protein [Pantoea ananatis]MDI3416017.1 fimbrial protein [Pantoea sp. V106_11]PWW11144.1 type 1 fimbria pilin [Pantoea sp. AG702]